jgi:hypothetical protein
MDIYETAWGAVSEVDSQNDNQPTFTDDVAATPRKQLIVEIKAAWPKTWPPLADELVRRFHVNTLDYLSEDMLRAVRLAIAM